jgi:hypothetical protein
MGIMSPYYPNRPVFGLVRTMTAAAATKKFDAQRYIEQQGV